MKISRRHDPAARDFLARQFDLMSRHYGPTHWWPGDSPFEIAVGAILTQNTAWTNVEKAIANLKRERLLAPDAILDAPDDQLEQALLPSGYFRVKAKRLRGFCRYLADRYDGDMRRMAAQPLEKLRPELLATYGIGHETADDILLYACEHAVFVVDAYTRRILGRHGILTRRSIPYEDLRRWLERHIDPDLHRYREYHGLLVFIGKDFCRRAPRCAQCPLGGTLRPGQPIKP